MLSEQTKIEIGNRIRDFRVQNKYTQTEFAEGVDISINFLSEIENGKKGFSAETLYNMCSSYQVSADFILFGDKETNNPTKRVVELTRNMTHDELDVISEYIQALKKVIDL